MPTCITCSVVLWSCWFCYICVHLYMCVRGCWGVMQTCTSCSGYQSTYGKLLLRPPLSGTNEGIKVPRYDPRSQSWFLAEVETKLRSPEARSMHFPRQTLPPLPCCHLAWPLFPSSLLVTICYLLHLLSCPSKTKTLNSRHTQVSPVVWESSHLNLRMPATLQPREQRTSFPGTLTLPVCRPYSEDHCFPERDTEATT